MVVVREWDPAQASDTAIEAMVASLNEALAVDLPDDPPWQVSGMREYLAETLPGEQRVCWLVGEGDRPRHARPRQAVGHASLLLLGDIGVLEVVVHPAHRSEGYGRARVAAAAGRAAAEGLASLGVEAIGETPAPAFWEKLGFRSAYVERRSVLSLAAVDYPRLARVAGEVGDDYRVEYHAGGLPKPLLEPYAAAKATRYAQEEPVGTAEPDPGVAGDAAPELDPEQRPGSYDAHRLADSLATLARRGMRPHLVLAIHEPSGEVAALTEVVVPAQHPGRADQYDTIVVPAHQGLGLERAVKARMLRELSRVEPQLTEVQTWNAPVNDPMADVNTELGYRPDREWREYEINVVDLVRQLEQ